MTHVLIYRWEGWFASELIAPADRSLEINRRFRASNASWKIRTHRPAPNEPASQGVLRAFVSPTYASIDDRKVFETLGTVLVGQLDRLRFVRTDITAESSQYAAVSLDEVDLGVVATDRHRNGFLIANSEVGSRSLTFFAWLWRLVCTNGLVAPESRRIRIVHRLQKAGTLVARFAGAVQLLPESWRAEALLRRARQERESEQMNHADITGRSLQELLPAFCHGTCAAGTRAPAQASAREPGRSRSGA